MLELLVIEKYRNCRFLWSVYTGSKRVNGRAAGLCIDGFHSPHRIYVRNVCVGVHKLGPTSMSRTPLRACDSSKVTSNTTRAQYTD